MYSNLSKIYDLSMKDTDYVRWYNIIQNAITSCNTKVHNILELGIGSGNITIELLKHGYEVVGIDSCLEMLDIAREKTISYGNKIILLNQDITDLDLEIYEIDMIIACNDVINYIYNTDDLIRLFRFAHKHLKNDGIFLFDYSSLFKFKHILDGNIFSEEFEKYYYVWKNFYDKNKLQMQIDIFEKQKDNSYIRYQENQTQVTYTPRYIANLLSKVGFDKIKSFCDFNKENKNFDKGKRIFFYVQK